MTLQQALRQELYQRSFSSAYGQIILIFIFAFITNKTFFDSLFEVSIALTIICFSALRFYCAKYKNLSPNIIYSKIHDLVISASALCWGALCFYTVSKNGLNSVNTFTVFMIASGVSSAGAFSTSPIPRLSLIFSTFILIPTALSFFSLNLVGIEYLLGIIPLLYIGYIYVTSKNYYKLLCNNFNLIQKEKSERLRAENATTEMEKQRVRAENSSRLAALGKISSNIAHEINTPLTTIRGRSTQLLRSITEKNDTPTQTIQFLNIIVTTCDRIAKIIEGLRTISRDGEGDRYLPVYISSLLEEMRHLTSEKLNKNGIKLEIITGKNIQISCRKTQILQVLINLINNSFDAIENLDAKWIKIECLHTHDTLKIEVTDSGLGIDKNIIHQIMNPFFTTKDSEKGTGLGLSISSSIIEAHQGFLKYNTESKNTQFVIELPIFK